MKEKLKQMRDNLKTRLKPIVGSIPPSEDPDALLAHISGIFNDILDFNKVLLRAAIEKGNTISQIKQDHYAKKLKLLQNPKYNEYRRQEHKQPRDNVFIHPLTYYMTFDEFNEASPEEYELYLDESPDFKLEATDTISERNANRRINARRSFLRTIFSENQNFYYHKHPEEIEVIEDIPKEIPEEPLPHSRATKNNPGLWVSGITIPGPEETQQEEEEELPPPTKEPPGFFRISRVV
jgi:hypothetical protein